MQYIKVFRELLENKHLSPTDVLLMSILIDKSNYHKGELFYCYEGYLADELNVSESTIKRSVKKLKQFNLIDIFNKNNDTKNYYKVKYK